MRRLVALAWLFAAAAAQADGDAASTQHVERGGVALDFSLTPLDGSLRAGSDAKATLRVSDARTGLPLAGMRPHAWISRRASEMLAAESLCTDKARALASGSLTSRADIDLNSYRVLTLNHDKTISVINPLISFGSTKLENLIVLPATGADWILSPDAKTLAVSLPEIDAVALIDTASRKVVAQIATGAGSQPQRLALDPAGRIWVGLEGSGEVAMFAPAPAAAPALRARVPVGRGLLNFAFSADMRHVFVSNSASDRVIVIDAERAERVADVPVGKTPVAMAYGAASRLLYVALLNDAAVAVVDPDHPADVKHIAVARGVNAIGFEREGRFALALSQLDSSVTVIDSADQRVIGHSAVVKEPDQLFFTQSYAYVHAMGSEKFSLLDLAELRAGTVAPVDIQAGRQPPALEPEHIGRGPLMAPTPDGNAVMIANAPDRTLYFYQEGMMAPMGTFSNYGRAPRSVMVLDHSLRETDPGVYSATVYLTHAGRFDVPVVIDQPRLINCFVAEVAVDPKDAAAPARTSLSLKLVDAGERLTALRPGTIRFLITDSASGAVVAGLKDARALLFEPPGLWQRRVPLEDLGDGHYGLREAFPHKGQFNVMIEVPSRGLQFADLAPFRLQVHAAAAIAAASE